MQNMSCKVSNEYLTVKKEKNNVKWAYFRETERCRYSSVVFCDGHVQDWRWHAPVYESDLDQLFLHGVFARLSSSAIVWKIIVL